MKNGITMIPFGLGKKEMKITAGSDKTFVKFSCFVADLLKLLSKHTQKNLKKYGRSGQNVSGRRQTLFSSRSGRCRS